MAIPSSKKSVSTFSIPPAEEDRIDRVRLRLAQAGHLLNRSEVVRLGLIALEDVHEDTIGTLVDRLDRMRPGRPNGTVRKSARSTGK